MILLNSVRFSDLISLALLAFRMFPYHLFMLEQDRWGGGTTCVIINIRPSFINFEANNKGWKSRKDYHTHTAAWNREVSDKT